jgi:ribosome-associated toxin RatA of RatAB toxin-antitoxin module
MVLQTEETIIAQKMKLESKWNFQYLEQGQVTLDMLQIEYELKKLKAKLIELAAKKAWLEVNTTEEELERVDSIAS